MARPFYSSARKFFAPSKRHGAAKRATSPFIATRYLNAPNKTKNIASQRRGSWRRDMQSLREGFLSGGPVGRVTCPLRGVAPSRGVWRRGSRFMLGRETSESSSSAKKRQNPETFLKRFRGCLSSGSRIRTDDLRVMSPTSYLAAPSRITLCPSASKGRGTLKVLIFLSTVFLKIFMQNFQERPRSSPKPSKIVPKRYTTGQEFTSGIKGFGASNTYSFGAPLWQKHPPSSNASTQPSTRTPPTWMPCGRT